MFFRFFRRIAWILGHIMYRFEVTGRENIPKDGAFLLCSNHIHAFDPIGLAIFMKRSPRFMAKKQIFKRRIFGWFLLKFGAYPLDREASADLKAFRQTMDYLKQGEGIIIFSQGTRMKEFDNAKSGVAVFSLKSGAPIIPAGIRASYKLFSKVHIHYGKPILPQDFLQDDKRIKTEIVETLMQKVVSSVSELAQV
ncbi:MAG: 1-acyl-sn-glycerol-3-phosphate acyltransferase [Defluviitaleaceae bacterium]|nr:1-acyl-sn-glycerol-3-phosphate acyltransferase [Defluviitaleaceae bacterium]